MERTNAEHLSQISTFWTMLFRAHAGEEQGTARAQHELLERYGGAVYRYLLGAVRDPDAAADLTQEFAVRFLRGDFHRADPDRGRFRDYLKTALIHMATDYRRDRQRQPRPLDPGTPAPELPDSLDDDAMFLESWRTELLDRTWEALAAAHPTQHAALLTRVNDPDLPSPEVAERISGVLGRPLTAAAARKALQRAHGQFAELLVEEAARSLGESTTAELEAELTALDLLRYCRSAFTKRGGAPH